MSPEDPEVAHAMRVYDQLGADPPKIDVALNDAAHSRAHTIERHGPDVPLRRQPGVQTIEGRIHGDHGWGQPENQSFKWDAMDASRMPESLRARVAEKDARPPLEKSAFAAAQPRRGHRRVG